jgi:DNA polymerase-3 subunit beta
MKATCNREGLLAACQLVNAAMPNKDVKPILKNIKAVAVGGRGDVSSPTGPRCTLIATDLEVGIRLDVQGLTIEEPGEAILPAKLIDILREARDAQLSIEADSSSCTVRGTTSPLEFEMPSEDAGQFPDFPDATEEKHHEITAGALHEMIRRTIFAVSDPETGRYAMSGVCWELEGGQARLVATDGRRLALAEGTGTTSGGHATTGASPVVSKKAMQLLERNLLDDPEGTVKVCIRRDDAFFRTGRAVIYCRLIEGRFPDWKNVIPKKHAVKVTLNTPSFQAAVRQAAIMTDRDGKRVTFKFSPDRLTLQAQGSAAGRSKVELPLDDYSGVPVDINFNPDYLIEFLKVLPPDAPLELRLNDGSKPALFKCGEQYSYLVMPLT